MIFKKIYTPALDKRDHVTSKFSRVCVGDRVGLIFVGESVLETRGWEDSRGWDEGLSA